MEKPYAIAAFRSRQQVVRFEEMLRRARIPADIINTPRDVALGCGLSVRFDPAYIPRAQAILASERGDQLIGLYLVRPVRGRNQLTAVSI